MIPGPTVGQVRTDRHIPASGATNLLPSVQEHRANLSRVYQAALQAYLKQGPGSDLEAAREVGRNAVSLGLETLDLARVHEIALAALVLPGFSASASASAGLFGRAGLFFAEAITPLEQTHRGAREANAQLTVVVAELSQRSLQLSDSVEGLHQEIIQRKFIEESLRTSEQTARDLLAGSLAMEAEMRSMSHQLLTAQEEERSRISRELHDVIAQTLSGINVRLSALMMDSAAIKPAALQDAITVTQRLVEQSVDAVHRFARDLRPTMLDDLGLIPALRAHLHDYMETTGIRASLTVFAGIEQSDSGIRTTLYRVAQEALTNVARHAHATRVDISIRESAGHISMSITDDGSGFDVAGKTSAKKHNRLGLMGMRERVEMVGGVFSLLSAPGRPTTVQVDIPMVEAAAAAAPAVVVAAPTAGSVRAAH